MPLSQDQATGSLKTWRVILAKQDMHDTRIGGNRSVDVLVLTASSNQQVRAAVPVRIARHERNTEAVAPLGEGYEHTPTDSLP